MKTFKLKSFAALTFVLFIGLQIFAGELEQFGKEYHKTFKVNKDVNLEVANKFGFVKIITSETSEVKIDVKITVEAKNIEKAKKLLEQINVVITGSPSKVTAITEFEKDSQFKELSIDYTITMPVSGNIDITNKFGAFYLNQINGKSKVAVSYGSVDIGNLNSQENDLTVKFGSGKVKYAQYLNYTSRYSTASVKRAKLLNLDAQYGNVEVGEVGRMSLKNAYGDADLGTVVELTAEVKFGDLDIEGIIGKFIITTQYGDLDVDFISKDFDVIDIKSSFGDVDLSFQSGSNFILEGKASFGDINLPGGTISEVDDSGNSDTYNGKMFEGTSPSTVKAHMNYGDLAIHIH